MVDNPIQQGNWFSSLRAWHASRPRKAGRATAAMAERPRGERAPADGASSVDLSRWAMAATVED